MNERPGGDIRRRELGPGKANHDKRRINPYLLTFEKAPGWGDSRVVKKVEKTEPIKKTSAADAFEAASRRASKKPRRRKPQKKKREEEMTRVPLKETPPAMSLKDIVDHSADDPVTVNGEEVLFDENELAAATGRHVSNFKRWITKPWFPKKVSGTWKKAEVIAAVEANTRKLPPRKKKSKPKVGSFFSPPKKKGSLDRLCKLYDLKVLFAESKRQGDESIDIACFELLDDLIADEKGLLKS